MGDVAKLVWQRRDGSRHVKIAERIGGTIGVPPEVIHLPAIEAGHDAVASHDLRLEQGRRVRWKATSEDAVPLNPASGQPTQALGDVEAFDPDLGLTACRGLKPFPAKSESVGGAFVAVTSDRKPDWLAEQARFVEGDNTAAVSDEHDPAGGLEFHERHAAARLLIDDLDGKRLCRREGISD